MESRGIYMSTADVADEAQFPIFKQRIVQFIDFRNELVRRATKVNPAAGREWGDNDTNRSLRIALNSDLEAFARILDGRAILVTELADKTRMASWYLALLGLSGLLLTALNLFVIRRSVIAPLSDIAKATDSIAAGKIDIVIPHV